MNHVSVRSLETNDLRSTFERFVQNDTESVIRLAHRLLSDREEALDLAQDALLKAHRGLARFRQESSLKTWIFRITINEGLKRLRRRRLADVVASWFRSGDPVALQVGHGLAPHTDPEKATLLSQQHQLLQNALNTLPSRQRTVVVLRYWEQWTISEIAQMLAVGEGTVKTHLVRALRRLRQFHQNSGVDHEDL